MYSQMQKGDIWEVGWDVKFLIYIKLLNRRTNGPWVTINIMTLGLLWVSHKPPIEVLHSESLSKPKSQPKTSRHDLMLFNETETRQIRIHETSQPSFSMKLQSYFWIYVVKIASSWRTKHDPSNAQSVPKPFLGEFNQNIECFWFLKHPLIQTS